MIGAILYQNRAGSNSSWRFPPGGLEEDYTTIQKLSATEGEDEGLILCRCLDFKWFNSGEDIDNKRKHLVSSNGLQISGISIYLSDWSDKCLGNHHNLPTISL